MIVVLPAFGGGVQILHQDLLLVRVDEGYLVPGMHVDVVFIAELPGCPGDERIFPVDQTGDIVGNTSG